jgi:rhodanese-related sulfurtransferase
VEQFFEFIGNHLVLSSMWVASAAAIIFYQARTAAASVGPQQAVMLINRQDAVVVDIRDKKEFEAGHIVDAIHIPLAKLKQRAPAELKKFKERPVLVVCKMGQHAGDAVKTLEELGHTEVSKLSGGVTEWKAQSYPLVQS